MRYTIIWNLRRIRQLSLTISTILQFNKEAKARHEYHVRPPLQLVYFKLTVLVMYSWPGSVMPR